jgi:methylated-DNA-protein-cysteine methyltransferase related protein
MPQKRNETTYHVISSLVYEVVEKIPQGKVLTYKGVAKKIGKVANIHPREVGRVLHQNPDPKTIPCHRVVNYQGRLAGKYAFGGLVVQRKKLKNEGVVFKNEKTVDLKVSLWNN